MGQWLQMGNEGRDAENGASPSVRRLPAAWLRWRVLVRLLSSMVPVLLGLGMGLGALLALWVPVQYLLLVTSPATRGCTGAGGGRWRTWNAGPMPSVAWGR